jgi:hypothetical protein
MIPPAMAPIAGRAVGTAAWLLVAEATAWLPLFLTELTAASPLWTALLILAEIEEAAAPVAVEASERRLASSEDRPAVMELSALAMPAVTEERRDSAPEAAELSAEPAADVIEAKP